MKRVLFVENSGEIVGGGQLSLLDLMDGLDGEIYLPLCVCPCEGSMTNALRKKDIPVWVLELPALRLNACVALARAIWRLYRLLRGEHIELVHANGSRCMFYAGLAGRIAGVPIVWHLRVVDSDGYWDRLLAALAVRIIANSQAVRQRLAWLQNEDKVQIIYNGENLHKYRRVNGTEVRRELGVEDGYLIAMVGRLSAEKDYETYLKAARVITAQMPQTRFLVVGKDPDTDQARKRYLEQLANQLGLSDRVVFTGLRQDIPRIMVGLDVLVHCAHTEAFGRVLVEAMAAETPVVATAVGGIPEVIEDNQTGLLVDEGDVEGVGMAVLTLLKDAARRREMGRKGRTRVENHFSLEAHVEQVQNLYGELLGA